MYIPRYCGVYYERGEEREEEKNLSAGKWQLQRCTDVTLVKLPLRNGITETFSNSSLLELSTSWTTGMYLHVYMCYSSSPV